jgi:pyruvate dehydrogenase E1 component
LAEVNGPVVAVSDFMRAVPDQVARWVPGDWLSLGTDGFGRSDTREALRRFFEIDDAHIVVGVLSQLALRGEVKPETVAEAIRRYDIDPQVAESWNSKVH